MGVLLMDEGVRTSTMSAIAAPKKKWIQHYMQGEEPKESVIEIPRPRTPVSAYMENGSAKLCTLPAQYTSVINGSYFTEDRPSSRSQSPTRVTTYGIASKSVTQKYRVDELPSRSYRLEEALQKASRSPTSPSAFANSGRHNDLLELKKRGGAGTREVHNKLEKNRRAHLRECFEFLRKQLPDVDDKKLSNLSVLKNALRHIQTLKRKERDLEHILERLARDKIALQQRLTALRKEASSIPAGSSPTGASALDLSSVVPILQLQIPASLTCANLEDHNLQYSGRPMDDDMYSCSTSTASEKGEFSDHETVSSAFSQLPRTGYFHNGSADENESSGTLYVHRQASHMSSGATVMSPGSKLPPYSSHGTKSGTDDFRVASVANAGGSSSGGFCIPRHVILPGSVAFTSEPGFAVDNGTSEELTESFKDSRNDYGSVGVERVRYFDYADAPKLASLPLAPGRSQRVVTKLGGSALPLVTSLAAGPRFSTHHARDACVDVLESAPVRYMTSTGQHLFKPLVVAAGSPSIVASAAFNSGARSVQRGSRLPS